MPLFRKKPVVIEAVQWFEVGDHPAVHGRPPEMMAFCGKCERRSYEHGEITTLESKQGHTHEVCPGDWIITGVQGEVYACKPDIFAATYEPVEGGH